jgi:hypothetical protein
MVSMSKKNSMALALENTVAIIELMENYVEGIRPPLNIRHKLDINYKIEGQSVFLLEIRPSFQNPEIIKESGYAKATFVKSENKWKVYWMRANLKWTIYEPAAKVKTLKEFIMVVEEDKYHCFKG